MKRISIERAIEILDPQHRERYSDLSDCMEQVNEACRMGMEALKKQIPRNCLNQPRITDKVTYCPKCGHHLFIEPLTEYCRWCGQALSWEVT